ncbi:nucleoside-diphosphate sugar epimerase/dehydratase [Aeromicrobium sp.]|uniref:polysaccharide biosynthesis protein n=1 Tax=Aeromicrobium sp. TaxID=1871063 RepID=UPI0019C3F214|nr:nucleoside-diphosphate sugar epimerase/dehydratase [Aeromicrobium sp.]MBC7632005.1 polysaccharide biosynthesis protein [Aeromicrobium sp.]
MSVLILIDALAWTAAMYFAVAQRFETLSINRVLHVSDANSKVPIYGVLVLAVIAIVSHVLLAWVVRLHQGRTALGSFEEMFLLVSVIIGAGGIATASNALISQPYVPRATPLVAVFIAVVFCAWPRGLWRILVSQPLRSESGVVSTPVMIVGAGDGGCELVKSMQRDSDQHWRPVAFVDDDRRKRHFRYRGIRVVGTTEHLGRLAARAGVKTVILAIPSADSVSISRLNEIALDANLDVKVLPSVDELLTGVHYSAVRDLSPEDLLGRHQVEIDVRSIAGYLAGKRVLVTGAGGSIGSELCRQIIRYGPSALLMLDRDESALHSLALSIYGRADLESQNVVLANIREADRMLEVFEQHRPDVVFHAAALKHVNMLENHASEAVKTNVLGTLNVPEAAATSGVERFVNVSTDKAADPINVLGFTKRIAEGLTAAFADRASGIFLSVRFGNVLGTRGSVLRTFTAQVEAGGPLTVTDPEVTRYFMTIREAVQLVIQAAAIGRDGEALVLDMGEPVKIADVARQVAQQAHRQIDIVYTGLKPGEKMHEVLFGSDELDVRPVHPLVSHVHVPVVSALAAHQIQLHEENAQVARSAASVCVEMSRQPSGSIAP